MKDIELIDLLRHSRHDWLNAIQLIKGNLSLNHVDRAQEIIDQLIIKSKNEANISNLHIPNAAAFLLTFNWFPHSIKLECEVTGDVVNLSTYDCAIEQVSLQVLDLFDKHGSSQSDNTLLFTLQLIEEGSYITFDFNGKINRIDEFEKSFDEFTYQSIQLIEQYIKEDEIILTYKIIEKASEVK